MIHGVMGRLRTCAPWRDLPERYGPWQTVYHRFNKMRKNGLIDRLLERLRAWLNAERLIDAELWCIDGTVIRAARAAGGAVSLAKKVADEPEDHALGRSRGGFGTKVHLVRDGHGVPLAVTLTPGQRHESTQFEAVLGKVRLRGPRCRPVKLTGDKGYSYGRIWRWLARHGIKAVIPRRKDQRPDDNRVRFDREAYRRRSTVERCIGWLKECRAVATRFDKLAVNDQATIH